MRDSGQFTEAGTADAMAIAVFLVDRESAAGEGKAKPWYTGVALSDLAVSGGLAFNTGKFTWHRFPQAPTAYTHESPTR
jgi:hypothetical protein